jgi:hypothetical protein
MIYVSAATDEPFVFSVIFTGLVLILLVLQMAGGLAREGSITGSGLIGIVMVKSNPTHPLGCAVGVIVYTTFLGLLVVLLNELVITPVPPGIGAPPYSAVHAKVLVTDGLMFNCGSRTKVSSEHTAALMSVIPTGFGLIVTL